MMDDNEDRFDAQLVEAAQDYHRPPETPRDEMWAAIRAARRRGQDSRVIVSRPWMRWTLGIAAVLALGIGIGRWTARRPELNGPPPPAAAAGSSSLAYQLAATQYLTRTEALLTGFRARPGQAALDASFVASARDLLGTTRLLLDSPASQDPRLRPLLEDLELVLAQIAQLSSGSPGGRGVAETDLITQGLEQRGVLSRLRTAIPSGPAVTPSQGAL